MPNVSEEFVKSATAAATGLKALLEKKAEQDKNVSIRAALVADTMIAHGLIKAHEKGAAIEKLTDHVETLDALNLTAAQVRAHAIGESAEKDASVTENKKIMPSDLALYKALGLI